MASIKKQKKSTKKEKVIITFDEDARREFLTGFRKRKNERRKKAQDDIVKKEKERKIQMKAEKREQAKKLLLEEEMKTRDLEAELGLSEDCDDDINAVYDHPDQTVTVTTVTDLDLGGEGSIYIGANMADEEDEEKVATKLLQKKLSQTKKNRDNPKNDKQLQRKTGKRNKSDHKHLGQKKKKT